MSSRGTLRELLRLERAHVSEASYIIAGRSRDCDVVLADPTVSGRHARLCWRDGRILVEDLGSANGTFVGSRQVEHAYVRPGDDVRLGRIPLPWSSSAMRAFLRRGASGETIEGVSIPGRRFICGACGARGLMPYGFRGGELRCGRCGMRLHLGPPKRGSTRMLSAVALVLVVVAGGGWVWRASGERGPLRRAAQRLGFPGERPVSAASPQEASIRTHTVPRILEALDSTHRLTRNTAARIAADDQGPYKVEQTARLWSYVRDRWRYVNDPRGSEYFATASETIDNGLTGDCDDFAVLLTAMITAIGGEARVVMMDGPQGGHAYAEACIHQAPDEVRSRLSKHYDRSAQGTDERRRVRSIHFRPSSECPVWLNLDWNAGVPGGPYEREDWAVAIYPDGRTETIAPAGGSQRQVEGQGRMRASSPPRP